jgi:NAD(P)-dependent dehydrogenase (short-subunit alcohol dehydrogenase family)
VDRILDTVLLTMDKTGLKRNKLAGDVAVVTGGTSNIGLGTARCLAWLGAKVVIAARNQQTGMAAAELINKENGSGTALFVSTDVSDEASMKVMAKKAFDTFSKVDILVNNAMDMSLAAPILKSTIQQLDRQYEVAVRGALIGVQLFVPGMQERHHGVVTYLATAFRYPMGPSNYCAVKSATSSLMMSLAAELGPVKDSGVAVFTFIPTSVGRPRTVPSDQPRTFVVPHSMPGYDGPIPPEDCGAALAYCITRAADLHGSGIMIGQAFRQMNWPFPKPETVPTRDYERIKEQVLSLMFGYMGPGFPDPVVPLVSINRSEGRPDKR